MNLIKCLNLNEKDLSPGKDISPADSDFCWVSETTFWVTKWKLIEEYNCILKTYLKLYNATRYDKFLMLSNKVHFP